jgi:hypothetical protein
MTTRRGCWRADPPASGDKTTFGVVVSRMAKVFKPNFAAPGREAVA